MGCEKLDINTVEGWNELVQRRHSQILIDRGIEPTEKNLDDFQEEIKIMIEEAKKEIVMKEHEVAELERIVEHFSLFSMPLELLRKMYDRFHKKYGNSYTYGLAACYAVGYIYGIRAERKSRKFGKRFLRFENR